MYHSTHKVNRDAIVKTLRFFLFLIFITHFFSPSLFAKSSSPCALPGCSWPGDDPNVKGWCISINIVSLDANYTHSTYTNGTHPPANSPPYGAAGNSTPFNYNYDLIDPALLGVGNACLGPVTCNDKTLTCKVGVAQNESFQAY